jgi:hypothetical protein
VTCTFDPLRNDVRGCNNTEDPIALTPLVDGRTARFDCVTKKGDQVTDEKTQC